MKEYQGHIIIGILIAFFAEYSGQDWMMFVALLPLGAGVVLGAIGGSK